MKKKLQITTILFTLVLSLIIPTTTYAATKSNAKTLQKAKPKITMTANDEQLTVKVNEVKYATKYQYVYATNKNFKNAKKVTTKSRTFTLKTKENKYYYDEFFDGDRGDIYVKRKIREDKNYYVKCRAVVKVNNKNYYSKWSGIKAKIITEKSYDETIPEEKAVWLDCAIKYNYDGYIPISEADADAHEKWLCDEFGANHMIICTPAAIAIGLIPETSYSSIDIYGPAGTSREVIDAYIKAINESNGAYSDTYDSYIDDGYFYNECGLYIYGKPIVVHHKAKYKIETL